MKLSFAPMEGITTYIYRRVHRGLFPGVDRYYSPFIAPDGSGRFKGAARRDVLPENNTGIPLVPQILCNRAEAFLAVAEELGAMGYGEVSLNAGCPSATVVPKHKGSGMLLDLGSLDRFLDEVFSRCALRISVKTRLGLESGEEFSAILEIYNRYPLSELIIHARPRSGMYKSAPDLSAFALGYEKSNAPVCYNGDIFRAQSLAGVLEAAPGLDSFMLGRGAAANPALFRELRGGAALDAGELRAFLERLEAALMEAGLEERFVLARLKELWFYLIHMFPGSASGAKHINKAQRLSDYHAALSALFSEGGFSPAGYFPGTGEGLARG